MLRSFLSDPPTTRRRSTTMGAQRLENKVALVTGGSRGIGRAIAERLGRDGAVVALTYARDETAANEVVGRIRKDGGRAFAIQAVLGRRGDAAALWAAFDDQAAEWAPVGAVGAVDVIVNNAGIGRSSDLASLTENGFDEIFAVNARAPF